MTSYIYAQTSPQMITICERQVKTRELPEGYRQLLAKAEKQTKFHETLQA